MIFEKSKKSCIFLILFLSMLVLFGCKDSGKDRLEGTIDIYKGNEILISTPVVIYEDNTNNPLDTATMYRVVVTTNLPVEEEYQLLQGAYKNISYRAFASVTDDESKKRISSYSFEIYADSAQELMDQLNLSFD